MRCAFEHSVGVFFWLAVRGQSGKSRAIPCIPRNQRQSQEITGNHLYPGECCETPISYGESWEVCKTPTAQKVGELIAKRFRSLHGG